jgi:hypothetical protein
MEQTQRTHHSDTDCRAVDGLIDRWESQREIKNLMGKYANCLILNRDAEACTLFWSQEKDDISLGLNKGWYAGQSAVHSYYQGRHERAALVTSQLKKRFPDQLGDRDEKDIFGIGSFTVKPMSCPVIEISGDGETAKGLWYCQGSYAETGEWGPTANWTWGYCAADFVLEGGKWRIWHLLCVDDVDCRCGTSWGKSPEATALPVLRPLPEFAPLGGFEMPKPNIPVTLRQYYTPSRQLTPPPELPRPYETFAATFSYGPVPEPRAKQASPKRPLSGDPISDEDMGLLLRVRDVEEIKTLVSKRVYYIAGDMRREELDALWVRGAEAQNSSSFGRNWGWYVGMEEIRRYYVDAH